MRVFCLEERLTQPPPESQMDLVSMKLENLCWRSVPAILNLDAIGVSENNDDDDDSQQPQQQTIRRFEAIQSHVNSMFGDKPSGELASAEKLLNGSIHILVASLPKIFTKYEDFWPTDAFLCNLLHFHSLQTFTENVQILALVKDSFLFQF